MRGQPPQPRFTIPASFLRAYLYCPRLPYLLHLGMVKPTEASVRGRRLHRAYIGLSVRAGRLVEEGVGFAEAVEGLRPWLEDLLAGLGSPDPAGEAGLLVSHRLRHGFEGLPVRGEVEVEGGLVRGRVDLFEGCVPVEVKTGRAGRGDVAQALAYGVASGCGRAVVDYLGRGRVVLRVGSRAAGFVEDLVFRVIEAISSPGDVPRGGGCGSCPYRVECRLVFP